ncbi:hypothetical protein GCM10028783_26270 [Modestobacter muralis]
MSPVAMSTALRLLNFTFDCLLDPRDRGGTFRSDRPGIAGRTGLDSHERHLSYSFRNAVGQGRRANTRQTRKSESTTVTFL